MTGGSYAHFAGKEVARALGKMSMDSKDCTDKVDDLTPEQLKTLEDWEAKLKAKYPVVGKVRTHDLAFGLAIDKVRHGDLQSFAMNVGQN